MAADGEVVFEISADDKKGLQTVKEFGDTLKKEASGWESTAKEGTDSVGNSFMSMFKKIASVGAIVKAGKALMDFASEAVGVASALTEVQNVVDVTFGSGANKIEAWATKAGQQFGLTELQAKQYTSSLGAMMKSAGMAEDQIVDIATDLSGLAADMASFYNLDFDVAFEKIRAGMAGLSKPLRDLGINMNVANLEAYALSQGITKSFKSMTQSEQTMIRYQYLMQATADAQGDFSRTSNELANAQRRVETAVTNIKAALGKTFYDTVAEATNALATFLEKLAPAEKPKTVLDDINDIQIEKEQKLADIKKIADQANALLIALQKVNTDSGVSENSDVIGFVKEFTNQLSGLESATENAETMKTNIGLIAEGLNTELGGDPTKWENLLSAIKTNAAGAIAATQGDSSKTKDFLENVAAGADDLTTDYSSYWESLLGVLGDNAADAIEALAGGNVAGTALAEMAAGANDLGVLTGAKWQTFADALGSITSDSPKNLSGIADALSKSLSGDSDKWANMLKAISGNAKAAIEAIGDNDGSKTKAFLSNVAEAADDLTTDYSPYWTSLLEALGDNAEDAISALAGGTAAGADLTALASGANALGEQAGGNWDTFIDALGGLAGKSDVGTNLESVANALSKNVGGKANQWEKLLTAVGTKLGAVTSAVNSDGGVTADFLEAAAAAADDLGDDYSFLWGKLLATLGTSAPAAVAALKDATNTGDNLGKIANGANELTVGKTAMWGALLTTLTKVDGLNNVFDSTAAGNIEDLAKALSNNSPDVTQAEAWQIFLDALGTNPEALTALTEVDADATAEWLTTMSEAVNSIDPTDAQAWGDLLGTFVEGLPGLNDTQYGDVFFNTLKNNFLAMGSESDVAAAGLRALGYSTEDITSLQSQWLIMIQELVKKIPGLSSIINTQTGEIEGGTQALADYIKEWEQAETKAAYLESWSKARKALNEQYSERYGMQAKVWITQGTVEDLRKRYEDLGGDAAFRTADSRVLGRKGAGKATEEDKKIVALHSQLTAAMADAAEAQKEYNEYIAGYNEALEQSDKELQAIEEHFGETAKAEAEAAATTKEMTENMSTLAKAANEDEAALKDVETAVKTLDDALKALTEYQDKVRSETESSVRTVVNGFGKIVTPMQEATNKVNSLKDAYNNAKDAEAKAKAEKEWKDAENNLKNNQISITSMTQGLNSQLTYMREYQNMLAEARAKGISEDILATLSDGSAESYDYLYALTQYEGDIEALNKAYADVQKEAEGFTNTLTDQKLKADENYKSLVQNVQDAISGLNMGDAAYESMSATLQGIIDACGDKSESIKKAVDSIFSQLYRLSSLNFGVYWTNAGRMWSKNNSVWSIGQSFDSHANGMDYVPYDGYLALLHQGERIQTAAEADLTRRYSYQQPSFDYSAAGAAIGANMPRGNVYLDGRIVGDVLSSRQANSYRALERSGWQG